MTVKVLIIDDSVVIRRLVSDVVNADPDLEVVDTAVNGRIGIEKITSLNPDIVTLDIEMPEMDGLETIKELRKTHPDLPVIMFSTLTERGSASTLEALARGATDYVTKPANVGSTMAAIAQVKEQLIPRLKALAPTDTAVSLKAGAPAAPRPGCASVNDLAPNRRTDAVVLGSSTGGPTALEEVFSSLEHPLPVPLFVVQHIPEVFSKLLADRLDRLSVMTVVEASDDMVAEPGVAYIARGGRHMDISERRGVVTVSLNDGPPVNSCRPAVDILFDSATKVYGPNQLGVVLTGMGQDGLVGCEALRDAGAPILVQDEASSVVWGMPGYVARAGLAHEILPIQHIGPRVAAWSANRTMPVGATSR